MDEKLRQENRTINSFTTQVNWGAILIPSIEEGRNSECIKTYDDNANIYDDDMDCLNYGAPPVLAEAIHKYAKGDTNIRMLDIGCGTGLIVRELQKLAHYTNVDGLEPAARMLKVGIEKGYYKKGYNQFFGLDSGIEKDSYDIIFSVGAFVPNHIKAVAVKEVCRITKPGGFAIIATRASYMTIDKDLAQLRPIIQEMERQGEIRIVEDREFDNYFINLTGQLFVLQKV